MRKIWKYRRSISAGLLVALSSRPNAPPTDFEAMDDDASYAAVTMIQTNVRAHQIRKRKQKERDSDGSRDTPSTPGRGRAEVTPARTEELDGWKRRAARNRARPRPPLRVRVSPHALGGQRALEPLRVDPAMDTPPRRSTPGLRPRLLRRGGGLRKNNTDVGL